MDIGQDIFARVNELLAQSNAYTDIVLPGNRISTDEVSYPARQRREGSQLLNDFVNVAVTLTGDSYAGALGLLSHDCDYPVRGKVGIEIKATFNKAEIDDAKTFPLASAVRSALYADGPFLGMDQHVVSFTLARVPKLVSGNLEMKWTLGVTTEVYASELAS